MSFFFDICSETVPEMTRCDRSNNNAVVFRNSTLFFARCASGVVVNIGTKD